MRKFFVVCGLVTLLIGCNSDDVIGTYRNASNGQIMILEKDKMQIGTTKFRIKDWHHDEGSSTYRLITICSTDVIDKCTPHITFQKEEDGIIIYDGSEFVKQ